jgi:hypothetical protein
MKRPKPKFKVGQVVFHVRNAIIPLKIISKRWLPMDESWWFTVHLGDEYIADELRPLTKRERDE